MDRKKQVCEKWKILKYKWLLNATFASIKTYLMNDLHNNPNHYSKSEAKFINQPLELF